jgi:hypothetical protein
MLHVDLPTRPELRALAATRSAASVAIYLPTSPLSREAAEHDRLVLKNLAADARGQLEAAGVDKRQVAALAEHLDDLLDDEEFWRFQAHSLAVFATPDSVRTFRLPNRLEPLVAVSDRFHLKPLLRSVTFPHEAIVLALSQNGVRVVEVFAELPPVELRVADMPKDAASAAGKASLGDRSPSGRIQGSEGLKVRLRQYARKVDAALRDVLAGRETPLLLATTAPLDAIYRSVNSYPHLAEQQIGTNPETLSNAELAAAARPLLDGLYAAEIEEKKKLFAARENQGRATTDLAQAARAATFGAVDTLLVDIDAVVPGRVDEEDGAIHLAETDDATSYGVVDEIAARALASGARVLAVRQADLPGGASLAAILRYAM